MRKTDGDPNLRWYAIQSQPRREDVAEHMLRRLALPVLCPRYRQRVILHGYRREVVRPLFPGYLFAAFDPERDLRRVHYTRGVRGVVTFGECPAEVPLELLRAIEERMSGGYVQLDPPPLRPGQRVEIVAGPFAGFTGIFQADVKPSERVAILLDSLRLQARVVLDRTAVRALS